MDSDTKKEVIELVKHCMYIHDENLRQEQSERTKRNLDICIPAIFVGLAVFCLGLVVGCIIK